MYDNGFKDVTNAPSVKFKKHLVVGDNLIMGSGLVRVSRKENKDD